MLEFAQEGIARNLLFPSHIYTTRFHIRKGRKIQENRKNVGCVLFDEEDEMERSAFRIFQEFRFLVRYVLFLHTFAIFALEVSSNSIQRRHVLSFSFFFVASKFDASTTLVVSTHSIIFVNMFLSLKLFERMSKYLYPLFSYLSSYKRSLYKQACLSTYNVAL